MTPAFSSLNNMRANGVRTLAAWCLGRDCGRHHIWSIIRLMPRSAISAQIKTHQFVLSIYFL
jgi:hypothetical protein